MDLPEESKADCAGMCLIKLAKNGEKGPCSALVFWKGDMKSCPMQWAFPSCSIYVNSSSSTTPCHHITVHPSWSFSVRCSAGQNADTKNSTSLRSSWFLARSLGSWISASSIGSAAQDTDIYCGPPEKGNHRPVPRHVQNGTSTSNYGSAMATCIVHHHMKFPPLLLPCCLDTCAVMRLQRKVRNRNCCCTKSSKP